MYKITVVLATVLVLQGTLMSEVLADTEHCLQKNREMVDLAREALEFNSNVTAQDLCDAIQNTIDACRDVLPSNTLNEIVNNAKRACTNIRGRRSVDAAPKEFAESLLKFNMK